MKTLYYNPIEVPVSIKYVSKTGEVTEVSEQIDPTELNYLQNLFDIIDDYQDIVVRITSHNEAYYPRRKEDVVIGKREAYERVPVKGEISLKDYTDGGGYLEDKHLYL